MKGNVLDMSLAFFEKVGPATQYKVAKGIMNAILKLCAARRWDRFRRSCTTKQQLAEYNLASLRMNRKSSYNPA
jgi:hypothetical protein